MPLEQSSMQSWQALAQVSHAFTTVVSSEQLALQALQARIQAWQAETHPALPALTCWHALSSLEQAAMQSSQALAHAT